MDLGWLDVCLRVTDVGASQTFYERLGFHQVEGGDDWAVMVRGSARIGLFAESHMEGEPFSLNFRGGNISEIVSSIGSGFDREPVVRPDGSGSAWLRDPDGHLIFFDTAPGETKKE